MLKPILVALALIAATTTGHAASLREAFDAAIARDAELRSLEAQRAVIEARLRGADALTPGAPTVSLGYTSDRPSRSRGFQEAELEFAVPVWLPGQSRVQKTAADAQARQLAARLAARRLDLAGEVRETYWAWESAAASATAIRARVSAARGLSGDAARQARAGQVAVGDALLARADARESEGLLREAEATLRDARLAFRTLTGIDPAPGWQEVPREDAAVADHPRLVAARLGLDVARAGVRLAEVEDRDSPEVGLFVRQERDDRETPWDTRFGVRVRIPFAHPPRNAERRATAEAEVSSGSAEHATAERRIVAERTRARAALTDARAQAITAEQRYRAVAGAAGLSERARQQGQVSLAETLRLRNQLAAADADRRRSDVALRQSISRLNQALGAEP